MTAADPTKSVVIERRFDEHERLVYTESMSNAEGKVLSAAEAGMPEGHPTVTAVRVELGRDGDATRLVLTLTCLPTRRARPGGIWRSTSWPVSLAAEVRPLR
ncbi:MAG: hypothetical protein ACR2H3_03845 [Acidimicrobiales bacterium]